MAPQAKVWLLVPPAKVEISSKDGTFKVSFFVRYIVSFWLIKKRRPEFQCWLVPYW
jgi:hypothetical protein